MGNHIPSIYKYLKITCILFYIFFHKTTSTLSSPAPFAAHGQFSIISCFFFQSKITSYSASHEGEEAVLQSIANLEVESNFQAMQDDYTCMHMSKHKLQDCLLQAIMLFRNADFTDNQSKQNLFDSWLFCVCSSKNQECKEQNKKAH